MGEKNIADCESEKKTSTSESADGDWLDGSRIHPVGSQMPVEDHSGPPGFRQETGLTEGERGAETRQDPKLDLDEEPTEEPMVENQGRSYPLRERRPPRIFSSEEHVLLIDEGDLDPRDAHSSGSDK